MAGHVDEDVEGYTFEVSEATLTLFVRICTPVEKPVNRIGGGRRLDPHTHRRDQGGLSVRTLAIDLRTAP